MARVRLTIIYKFYIGLITLLNLKIYCFSEFRIMVFYMLHLQKFWRVDFQPWIGSETVDSTYISNSNTHKL